MVAKLLLTNRRIGFYLYVLIGTIMNYFNLFCLILQIYFWEKLKKGEKKGDFF